MIVPYIQMAAITFEINFQLMIQVLDCIISRKSIISLTCSSLPELWCFRVPQEGAGQSPAPQAGQAQRVSSQLPPLGLIPRASPAASGTKGGFEPSKGCLPGPHLSPGGPPAPVV